MRCTQCRTRKTQVTVEREGVRAAAKRAVRNPTERNIELVRRRKASLENALQEQTQHASECTAEEAA